MPTTLKEVQTYLDQAGLKYDVVEEHQVVELTFESTGYRRPDGTAAIFLGIQLLEGGEFLRVMAPMAFQLEEGPNRLATLEACMIVSRSTKSVSFELDPEDGEICATIEFPLEDSGLTSTQLHRSIRLLLEALGRFYPTIAGAQRTGEIVMPDPEVERVNAILSRVGELTFPSVLRVRAAVEKALSAADSRLAPEML